MKTLSKLLSATILGMYVLPIVAMPTQKELDEAKSVVNELMSPHVEKLKGKSMSATEVGDKAAEFAANADADMQAAKYLFLRGAVSYYVQGKSYDKAADAIESIAEIAPEALLELTTRATRGVSQKNAPRLFALHRLAEEQAKNAKALQAVLRELEKRPGNAALVRSQAELTAASGKWNAALVVFAKLGGDIGKIAQDEIDGAADVATLADFWWKYTPQESGAKKAIAQRAAMHYRTAIANGGLDGLKKMLAERRIAEVDGMGAASKDAAAKDETGIAIRKKTPALRTTLRTGMVGYWPFDGDAKDASGSRNNGTATNVEPTEDRYGNAAGAYRFSGTGYVEVPHSLTLNLVPAYTVTAWIKPQRWYSNCMSIVQKGDQKRVHYQFQFGNGYIYCCGSDIKPECRQHRIELDKWQQVALTYESGKYLRYYHNGELVGQWSFKKRLPTNNGSLFIGKDPWGSLEYFIGDMDDVRLFNRALPEKEIQELYKVELPVAND